MINSSVALLDVFGLFGQVLFSDGSPHLTVCKVYHIVEHAVLQLLVF